MIYTKRDAFLTSEASDRRPFECKSSKSDRIYILNWGQYKAFLNPRLNTSPRAARLSILTEGSEKLILTPVKMMFTVISWNHHPKPA